MSRDHSGALHGPLKLQAELERWPLKAPFRITGYTWEVLDVVRVSLEQAGHRGDGEAAGVYYRADTAASVLKTIESMGRKIEAGINRDSLRTMLPAGGARNALDCALWDLEAKLTGQPVWRLANVDLPKPLLTTFTCGAESPELMAATARSYAGARAIKLKLTGEAIDADRVCAVREANADAWLGVDGNQGFTLESLERLMPLLVRERVAIIEQPLPVGKEALLEGFRSPIPLVADESAQSLADLPTLVGRFEIVNIKLDKCGGLTEGLAMARAAGELGLGLMVGNMTGTSLAMAPAFILGQLCSVVDLDGPIFLATDRDSRVNYQDGYISVPHVLWGYP